MATPDAPQPPAPIPPAIAAAAQIQPYIPPNVWTPEAVIHFHDRQKEVLIDNNRIIDNQRTREHRMAWAGVVLISGIIGFGCYLVLVNNPAGKDIIGATILFLSGYLAGQGQAKLAK